MPTMHGSFITRSLLVASLLATALVTSAQDKTKPAGPQTSTSSSAGERGQQAMSPCAMAMMGRSGPNSMYRPSGIGASSGSDGFGMAGNLAPLGMLALSADQRAGINKIQDESCKKKLDLADQLAGSQAELRSLYTADSRDAKAIDKQYEKLFALQRKAIEVDVDTTDRIEALLSPEQRDRLKQLRHTPRGAAP